MDKNERRKEVSEFAKRLAELAQIAPDGYTRRDLYRALHFIRQRYTISKEAKKQTVLEKIAEGAATFTDLLAETGYTKNQVARSLDELLAEKKIRSTKLRRSKGAGRPVISYFCV